MILGADHIAVSEFDNNSMKCSLNAGGYGMKFAINKLQNSQIKAPYLRQWSEFHEISLFIFAGSLSIEITRHAAGPDALPGHFFPIVRLGGEELALQDEMTDVCRLLSSAMERTLVPVLWSEGGVKGFSFVTKQNVFAEVAAISLAVDDPEISALFWQKGLSAKRLASGSDWCRLKFESPIAAWRTEVILFPKRLVNCSQSLDAPGFPCLALLSNNIEQDANQAMSNGFHATKSDRLEVNGRVLSICLLESPGGGLVELIQPM